MKKYIYMFAAILSAFTLQSCFQDLGQDIPFDYPEQPKPTYKAKYDGEKFYLSFDGKYAEQLTLTEASIVGTPGFDDAGKFGKAYKGAADSYITFTPEDLKATFSAVFWYKLNATPDKAGILTLAADDPGKAANAKNNRSKGFRLFRETGNGGQTFKLNVGSGSADTWLDGGAAAMLNPATTGAGWVFMAFTISSTECVLYINGQVVSRNNFTGVSWEGCTSMSIGSGYPFFSEWGHAWDGSLIDELRIFNKALTQQEIQTIMNAAQ